MSPAMWLQCLTEAEARQHDKTLPLDVRLRSAETAGLILQRMASEGVTRDELDRAATV